MSRHVDPMRAAVTILLVLVAGALSPGCGRKAALRPPEDVRPVAIADLKGSDAPTGIELSWSRPRFYVDHSRMNDLGGFAIERAVGTATDAPFTELARLEVSDRDRFRQISKFRHLDSDTTVGTQYRYRVVSFTVDGYFSAPSNVVTVERTAPAGAGDGKETHAPLPAGQR